MKWSGLIVAALLSPSVAHAERFAIHCTGTGSASRIEAGQTRVVMPPTPTTQIYVIDEAAQTVHRALMPRQEFEDLCGTQGRCFRIFSPGLIQIDHEIDEPLASHSRLSVDRQRGRADFELEIWDGAAQTQVRWSLTCRRGEIPVFDPSRNRL